MSIDLMSMVTEGAECSESSTALADVKTITVLYQRLGAIDRRQIEAWRAMSPARRLDIAFQAYQFALDALRVTERRRHPDLSSIELAWRVTRRMQGDANLGRP